MPGMTLEWDLRPFREPLAFGISDAALLAFNMRTAVAVTTRASAAFAGSPFGLLDASSALRLVTPCFAPVLDRQELMGCAGLHL